MSRRVFLHVGLPKTGTTYLQTLLWHNRDELRRQGVLLPGESSRQHLWASGVVREDPKIDRRGPDAKHAWDKLVAEINAWEGTAIVSHEFFASVGAEQAQRAVGALTGAEAHVVVTARETLSLVTARWQEFVKNGSTVSIDDYPADEEPSGTNDWDWGTLDLADVLRRWGAAVPPERVHVLTLPKPDEPRETLWLRFAELLGIDAVALRHLRRRGERVARRRRGGAAATGQRRPDRLLLSARPGQLDPRLPGAGQARAARR